MNAIVPCSTATDGSLVTFRVLCVSPLTVCVLCEVQPRSCDKSRAESSGGVYLSGVNALQGNEGG